MIENKTSSWLFNKNNELFIYTFINFKLINLWTPHLGSCVFHPMASSIFNLKNDFYWLRKWLGVATYFFVLFLKG